MEFLFGRCDRRRKRCRPKKRINVPGSHCNRRKKNNCSISDGCNYVKGRGCRRAAGYLMNSVQVANQIAQHAVESQQAAADTGAPPEAQVIVAAAAAADVAFSNATAIGANQEEATQVAEKAAEQAAEQAAVVAGVSPEDIPRVVAKAVQVIENGQNRLHGISPALQNIVDRNAALFGKRRTRFGSVCNSLMPKDPATCLGYRDEFGMVPCNWNSRGYCKQRPSAVTEAYASTHGTYMNFVLASVPALANMAPPPVPVPIAPVVAAANNVPFVNTVPERGMYDCVGRNEAMCGSNPNCNWQSGPQRCIRKPGHLAGQQYQGPTGINGFGKKRKSSRRKGCKSKGPTKKLPAKIRNLCRRLKIKTTKKVGSRRVCKPMQLIMKQIRKKMRKVRRTRRRTRRSGFGW